MSGSAGTLEEYRFPREEKFTPGGFPVSLCGKPLTTHPVVVLKEGADLKPYPEHFIPEQEELAADEMRITALGSGNPPVRRGQAATGWLVELGNGDRFIFDAGGGIVPNLWRLRIPPAVLDKLFLTHLHLDHVGGIFTLWDAMGWARNTPLHVWGASGSEPELGVAAFVDHVQKAGRWHTRSKTGIVPSDGMTIVAHEFDAGQFSPSNPSGLVYSENGVNIHAFPVDHLLVGAVGYRLEWKGRSMAFTADSVPTRHEAEQCRGVDVMIHELFIDAPTFSQKNNMPLKIAENVVQEHTPAESLGQVFSITRPKLGVGTHFFIDDSVIDTAFTGMASTFSGPVAIAQDLMVINVTPEQIVTRMAKTDMLHWSPPAPRPPAGEKPRMEPRPAEGRTPQWVVDTRLAPSP